MNLIMSQYHMLCLINTIKTFGPKRMLMTAPAPLKNRAKPKTTHLHIRSPISIPPPKPQHFPAKLLQPNNHKHQPLDTPTNITNDNEGADKR